MSDPNSEAKVDGQALLDEATQLLGQTNLGSLPRLFEKISELNGTYPAIFLPVELCCRMFSSAKQEAVEMGLDPSQAHEFACLNYRSSMPRLSGADNIRDFVACVAHGICIGVIPGPEGTRLLYAAQVAYSALPSPKQCKKRCKTSQMHTFPSQPKPNTSTI